MADDPTGSIKEHDSSEIIGSLQIKSAKIDVPSTKSEKLDKKSKKNCCTNFLRAVSQDAVSGSFVGYYPVAFQCLCCPGCCCSVNCMRPFCVASIATKVMNFIMLGLVTLLACFFIVPWPRTLLSHDSTSISAFVPCQGKVMRNQDLNGGCGYYGGYFMVYRCFFAFGTLMLTNSLIMINVKSTRRNPNRAKIHHGFWFYKYLYLAGLLFLYFLFLDGNSDKEGVFEYFCSIFGNILNILFTLVELTFVLDVVEIWVIENQTSGNKWADFIYWTTTGVITLIDMTVLINILQEFAMEQKIPEEEDINCFDGKKHQLDFMHALIILASVGTVVFLIVEMSTKKYFKKRFPNTGWMQVSVIALFNLLYLWSALYSSPHILSRPRCNWGQQILGTLQEGSKGVSFRLTGMFHGALAVLTLLYFTFVHGPKADTAPLSMAYYCFISYTARVPVFPDKEDSPEEYLDAIEKRKVWDDEEEKVAFSWSLFYAMMALGGFSLMMSMTNFTDPWGRDKYNSSLFSLGCKLTSALLATFVYMLILITPCCSMIDPESELMKKRRARKMKNKIGDVENGVDEKTEAIIETVEHTLEAARDKLAAVVNETAPSPEP